MDNLEDTFDTLKINLASPEKIKQWATRLLPKGETRGEITAPETISHRTLRPRIKGIFCERTFGPIQDRECRCDKHKRFKERKGVCRICGIELIESSARRYRMGYINLAIPVAHIWYLKGSTGYIPKVLGLPEKEVEKVVYFDSYIVVNRNNFKPLDGKIFLSDEQWTNIKRALSTEKTELNKIIVDSGAAAIKKMLEEINIEIEAENLRTRLVYEKKHKKSYGIKRLRVLASFVSTKTNPSWMILTTLPVMPPDLRPMIQLDGGRFASSDLNDSYLQIIHRNTRLQKLHHKVAPPVIIMNEKRMLQESVDTLISNKKRGKAALTPYHKPVKSLTDMIEGKQGIFRQNLLGKRVDYSGRSVIIVGPELKLYQCGLPKEIALELFQPFILRELLGRGIAQNITIAKNLFQQRDARIWNSLRTVVRNHPILLNRAPTLHRLGIQAFEPTLVEGKAIKLHPLVCPAFNADFDGDQMAVHVPLTIKAQLEARILMMAPFNFLSPATGEPIMTPGQDIVLGCYYLTTEDDSQDLPETHYFSCPEDCLKAYEQRIISLHSRVWVRMNRDVQDNSELIKLPTANNKSEWWVSSTRIMKKDTEGNIETQYVLTTPGRILLHKTVCDSTSYNL